MQAANRMLMREINRFNILYAIRDREMLSRVEIARVTGLSQATVTAITAELIEQGILEETEAGASQGGRRPILLALNPAGALTVGVHLAVDHLSVVLVNLQAEIIAGHLVELASPRPEPKEVAGLLAEAVRTCLWDAQYTRDQVAGIGVALPGWVDSRSGRIRFLPNFQWRDVDFCRMLTGHLGVPTYIENSPNVLAISEQWFGFGRGVDTFLLITMEHGIGMGIVIHGQLFRGSRGVAGEFGHTVATEDGPWCRCGQRGCLDAICGNNAILRDANLALASGVWHRQSSRPLSIDEVIAAARAGEPSLREIYSNAGYFLGKGLASLQRLYDPQCIILAGKGVMAGDLVFGPMLESYRCGIPAGDEDDMQIHVQQWSPTLYARAAGTLVLQEIYRSPANRLVPII